jgi:hypothetical protein
MLKRMITEPTLAIEHKHVDTIFVKNLIHMIVASNENWMVPVAFDNRRFAVFGVAKTKQNNAQFFKAVHKQLFEQDGLSALLYDLLNHKREMNLRNIPETEELTDQKHYSMPIQDAWWYELLCDGDLWKDSPATALSNENGHKEYFVERDQLYDHYLQTMDRAHRLTHKGTKSGLGRYLAKVLPPMYPRSMQQKSGQRYWIMPSLELCRRHFCSVVGPMSWPPEPEKKESGHLDF